MLKYYKFKENISLLINLKEIEIKIKIKNYYDNERIYIKYLKLLL